MSCFSRAACLLLRNSLLSDVTEIQTSFRSLDVQVDNQTSESWSDIIAQFADASIYQTWAYGAVRWGTRNLSHLVMRRDDQILAAAQLRIARLPLLPAGIAYLRWGPLCHRKGQALAPATVAEMVACLREEYCKHRRLTLQVIPNAYPGDARGAAYREALVRSALRPEPDGPRYRTVLVDLAPAAEAMRKRLDQKWRNHLNRSEKNGLELEASVGSDAYHEFLLLYGVMRTRKQFETSMDVDEFARIQEVLPAGQRMHTFLARKDGEAVAALVVSHFGDMGLYLLGATSERARELKAAYLLHWRVMTWLKERGARWYDLVGIDPLSNPGGFHFKAGFGGADLTQLAPYACHGGLLSVGVTALSAWRRSRSSAGVARVTAANAA